MRGILLDLDGTIYTDAGAIPGAAETIATLRTRKVPLRFLTNTTRRSRAALAARLQALGVEAQPEEIITPVGAAALLCQEAGYRRIAPFVPHAALEDFSGFQLSGSRGSTDAGSATPDAIIVGDLGEEWSFPLLQEAFDMVMAGADLIALSRDRYWMYEGELRLDAGPFVAAIEYATGKAARITGKPNANFFQAAVRSLHLDPGEVAMVGDDLISDVEGAQRAGCQGWLVRTGKFRDEELRRSGVVPDRVLTSVAEVPRLVFDQAGS